MLQKPRTIRLHLNSHNKNPTNHLLVSRTLGQSIKPFISLEVTRASDLNSSDEFSMSPDSGTAIITFLLSGEADFKGSTYKQGLLKQEHLKEGSLKQNDVLWILSGSGIHYSLRPKTQDCVSIKLRVALSPALESAPAQSICLASNLVERHGPAQVLLGRYKDAHSGFALPALVNYLVVRLSAGQEWHYEPPVNHSTAWMSVIDGRVHTSNTRVSADELAIYDNSNKSISFLAEQDSVFLLGSSQEYTHDLALEKFALPNEMFNKNNPIASKAYAL
jgi:redox-sensitive bicupin YhaK (pirin superfamily)